MNLTKINSDTNYRTNYGSGEEIIIENGYMKVARSSYKLKCPYTLDNDFAYLTGYHLGDGYLEDMYKTFKRKGRGSYEITYADKDMEQIKLISQIFEDKFGHKIKIYENANDSVWIGRIDSCKVLHWFLNTQLGLPIGKKNEMSIPKWILVNGEFLSNFLSVFFDAEGDISKTTNVIINDKKYYRLRIQLTQKNKSILLEIKDVLSNQFNIKSDIQTKWNQNAFVLRIGSAKMVKLFKDVINFRNPTKREKLNTLLNGQK